ncbi:ATPase WRNIP1-like [Telopea speciosissima]|uniref:ATPase WRNIP1-like n=1 Tax=Telopea speciosissima TaxID=54955 RepID=UPI001CC5670E|nr:ATPase WRNIP1-like [Telopea speciosissima]
MEMEQLLDMGFSQELATQALAATGGKSTVKATEWILSHKPNSNPNPIPNPNPTPFPSPSPSPCQPKLDRFLQSKTSSPQSRTSSSRIRSSEADPTPDKITAVEKESECEESPPKRPKLWVWPNSSQHLSSEKPHEPLSERMRPRTIDEVVGQDHLLGKNSILRSALDCDRLPSIVLWGSPGTGKTSIAKAIANSASVSYHFVSLSAVTAGVKDVRDAVEDARKMKKKNKRTVLFVDEVHRFNKSQQDSFLPVIEDGTVVFIGATTENPSFHLITPLLSRCRVLTLNPLQPNYIAGLLKRAADDAQKGLARSVGVSVKVDDETIDFLSMNCDGDARVALNALEISATSAAARIRITHRHAPNVNDTSTSQFKMFKFPSSSPTVATNLSEKSANSSGNEGNRDGLNVAVVTIDDAKEALQCKHLVYDRAGEEHYNLISALHKSMRGSDADAAIYWLARMLEGGELPLYIARRLVRFASEDVGLADPLALNQAVACYQACHFLGMPECNVILAQCVAYLALAPKSVAVYKAIGAAQQLVRDSGGQNEGVPLHLRNAPTKLMKELGYGKGYLYPPDHPSSSKSQTYMPSSLHGYKFLDWPTNK